MDIIVLLPKGHCTKIQELQMTTVLKENVHVFGVEGNSDELDEPIKTVFADVAFVKKHNLMSLNSINWSRVLVQMAHHFFAYFQCTPSLDMHPLPLVEVVVPTGAAGNLVAGCIAQKIGLPIRLVVAVNRNDIIHRTVQQGDFSLSEAVKSTLASAMDIQVPYNMERVFWLLSGSDSQVTRALMEQFERTQSVNLPKELHSKLSEAVTSESVSDEAITQTMGRCWDENQYLLCPHSAVAVNYHYQQMDRQQRSTPRCCLAPASAAKFPEAVLAAGLTPETPAEIVALEHKETRCTPMRRDKRKRAMFWHRFQAQRPVLGTEVILVVDRGVAWESGGLLPASAPAAIWLGALQYLITSLHCRALSANQWGWAIHSPMSSAFFLSPHALGL
ncbi:threonine synthase-like 2 isoform X9 [Symphalangus syndactylus]